ncbi:MAG: Cell wall-active antibiotics response YvqF, partial [Acidimicrobiaceae bacterium]|nr:Cell wall-active antibiotics response YvqF [Acidimicrobiaceae bacterium]
MPSDDELRRVAEDVRALARSLARDIRAAVDRARVVVHGPDQGAAPSAPSAPSAGRRSAREDLAAAGRAARDEMRQAQSALRQAARRHRHGDDRHDRYARHDAGVDGHDEHDERRSLRDPRPGSPPRWDNWGRHYRGAVGVRPGGGWRDRPSGPPPPRIGRGERGAARASVPAPPLRHRHDGSTLLGLLAVVFGLAWLAAGTHVAAVSTKAVIAVALMVLGAATVVTARTDWALSRRTWPVLCGAVLALGLLALSASPSLPVGFRHLEFGARTVAPATWADVPSSVHAGFGKTVIDLTQLPLPLPEARTLAVDGAAGRLEINVPADLPVVVDARVSAGMIDIDGVTVSGVNRAAHQVLHPTAGGPVLTIEVDSGFGSAAVTT